MTHGERLAWIAVVVSVVLVYVGIKYGAFPGGPLHYF